jgi:uncharacterized LabA/DUF88 family protein
VNPKLIAKIESEEPAQKLAVLIDADNAQASIIEALLTEIANYGEATVKRIYGDFTAPTSAQWKKELHKHAIKPVQQFAYTTGKNATDSTLIIDAMDLLYTRRFDGFCLVSSDSDFTGLALRLREEGLMVFGFGEQKTPEPFRNACHKFVFTEVLRKAPAAAESSKTSTKAKSAKAKSATTPATSAGPAPKSAPNPGLPTKFIMDALGSAQGDESGWIHLGMFGHYLSKLRSDFDPRLYGFKKLSDLVRAMPEEVEIEERSSSSSSPKVYYVRPRPGSAR